MVARRERKAATLCVGVRERRELCPNGSDDRENTQEEVGSSACPEPVAATSARALQPPASSQRGEPDRAVPPIMKGQVVESTGLSSQGQGTGHFPDGNGWEISNFRPWGLFLNWAG